MKGSKEQFEEIQERETPTIELTIKKTFKEKVFNLQNSIGAISKDSTNPFYSSKYFDINKLISELQPYLKENRLILTQPIRNGCVYSEITDIDSEDNILSYLELPKDITDPQKILACVTYFRRATLSSLLALQSEDDDGNTASQPTAKPKATDDENKPWLNEDGAQFQNALQALNDGKTMRDIRNIYKVSKKVEKLLTEN